MMIAFLVEAMHTAVCNSPANLAWIDSWNRLSSNVVHTTNGAGNRFTGDDWTANTRTRRD